MPPVVDQAVCCQQWDWSETSQTALLFTRAHGLVRGLAKGARRPKSAFSGGLEPLTLGEVTFHPRPDGKLAVLASWDLTDPLPGARRSLASMYVGLYALDLTRHALSPEDPHPALFDALCNLLSALGSDRDARDRALLAYQWSVASEAGVRPRLDDPPDPEARVWRFDPIAARLVPHALGAEREERWAIRADTVRAILAFAQVGPSALTSASEATIERANRFLGAFLGRALEAELPSARFVFGVRPHNP